MIKAFRLFTGEDGHSHVEEGYIKEDVLSPASSVRFKETEPFSSYDWHTAPVTQYVITLYGTLVFTTFPGETFVLKPGDILIALDTTGTGHKWQLIDNDPWKRVYVTIEDVTKINFVKG